MVTCRRNTSSCGRSIYSHSSIGRFCNNKCSRIRIFLWLPVFLDWKLLRVISFVLASEKGGGKKNQWKDKQEQVPPHTWKGKEETIERSVYIVLLSLRTLIFIKRCCSLDKYEYWNVSCNPPAIKICNAFIPGFYRSKCELILWKSCKVHILHNIYCSFESFSQVRLWKIRALSQKKVSTVPCFLIRVLLQKTDTSVPMFMMYRTARSPCHWKLK